MSKRVGTEPTAAEKQVAAIALDTVVKAYLEKQLAEALHEIQHKEEDLKKAEVNMIAQMQRFLGQREGEIEALKQQVASIRKQLTPDAPSPTEAVAPLPA